MATVRTLTFGTLLKRFRMASGLTQEELAARAGLSPKGISDLERGARRVPHRETVALLAEALGLSDTERASFEAAARQRAPQVQATARGAPGGVIQAAGAHAGEPPLAGRTEEMGAIERLLRGEGTPVLIFAGEPGIGKSRLLREAAGRAPAEGYTVIEGGCHRRSALEPFEPLVGALSRLLSQRTPAQLRLDLQGCAWLVRLLPELAGEVVSPVPGWPLAPEQERRLMFAAVARTLATIAGPMGTLLVLDDLHWAGGDLLDLLGALLRMPTDRPLRVLGAYRDTEIEEGSVLPTLLGDLAREGLARQMPLGALAPADAEALVGDLLAKEAMSQQEGARALWAEEICRHAGGIPFYLISYTHATLTSGVAAPVHEDDGQAIPWNVVEMIRQRIAALPSAAHELLAIAAITGSSIPRALLLAVAEMPEADALAALEAIGRARLLAEDGASAYVFPHDLVQEAVRSELSAARRASLHRRVAEALERQPGTPRNEALAYHYLHGERPEKAIAYLWRAGERAERIGALAKAEHAYRELIDQLSALEREAEAALARERLGGVLQTQAHYDEARVRLEEAIAGFRAAGDERGYRRATGRLAEVYGAQGSPAEGLVRLQPVLAEVEDEAPSSELATLQWQLASLHLSLGRYTEGLAAAERTGALAHAAGDPASLARAEYLRAVVLRTLGRHGESLRLTEELIERTDSMGGAMALAGPLLHAAGIALEQGELEGCEAWLARAAELAERLGDPTARVAVLATRGALAFWCGKWERARTAYEEARAVTRVIGPSWASPVPTVRLGVLCLAEGKSAEAAQLFDTLSMNDRIGNPGLLVAVQSALSEADLLEGRAAAARDRLAPLLLYLGEQTGIVTYCLPYLAWAHLACGELEQAGELLDEATRHCVAERLRLVQLDMLRVRGMLAAAREEWAAAERALDDALALARMLGHPHAEAKALFVAGEQARRRGEMARAREAYSAADALCRRLGERLYHGNIERALCELAGGDA
jgi:transcriptional regulator with XRE-family HTH domain/tetratricopeptide (TPR) repeat protein